MEIKFTAPIVDDTPARRRDKITKLADPPAGYKTILRDRMFTNDKKSIKKSFTTP